MGPVLDTQVQGQVQSGSEALPKQIGGVALADHNQMGVSDDDFFHLVCHIDQALKQKIEKGEYVDLDKLLPRDKVGFDQQGEGDQMEWICEQGSTYLVPAKRQSRINSFHRWEQAFCMYATIYCGANPNRARDIWQYISVINTAASSFVWNNVYNYDMIFRQLMQFNPGRSWAVTYGHMWNLSMREPLQSKQQFKSGVNFGNSSNSVGNNGGKTANMVKKKSDYCWNFNKGVKCRFGKNCRFYRKM